MPEVIVYGTEQCPKCRMTERAFDREGVSVRKVDVRSDAGAMTLIQSLGHRNLPVVVFGDTHWSDFRPDRIKTLASVVASLVPGSVSHEGSVLHG